MNYRNLNSFASVVVAACVAVLALSCPRATAQTSSTRTIAGVPGWSVASWGDATTLPTGEFQFTSPWAGVWYQAPRNVALSHITLQFGPAWPLFVGAKLADGRFAWAPVSTFVSSQFEGLVRVPIATILGSNDQTSVQVQAVAAMAGPRIAQRPFPFRLDAVNDPSSGPQKLPRVWVGQSIERSNDLGEQWPLRRTNWNCVSGAGAHIAVSCPWGGIGIERRTDDWAYQYEFAAQTWDCTMTVLSNAATLANGNGYVVIDRRSVQLKLGVNLTKVGTFGDFFRFTVPIPNRSRSIGLMFATPIDLRLDLDAACTLTI